MLSKKIFISGIMIYLSTISPLFAEGQYSSRQSNTLSAEEVERFSTAINEIKKYYVEDVDDKTLFENAIRGMLNGLDPHSGYLDMTEFAELKSETSGEFAGLGIEITPDDGYLRVISPIDGTPAQKAGLKPDDIILKINNVPVKDMSLSEAIQKMRGPKDTVVTLTLYRKSDQKVFNKEITRQIIKVESVKTKLIDNGYGYLRISQFQEPTSHEVKQGIANLIVQNQNKPLKGLVIDLRNNPGGLLDSAIEISDTFLDAKRLKNNDLIVYTKGRIPSSEFKAHATGGDLLNGAPIVILINQGSASASEIVAGALQDHHRAIIMGTKSFGKGSVQTVLPLDNLRGVKLTTALYYTPNGRSIQAKGIEPDVYVELMDVKKYDKDDMLALLTLHEADFKNHLTTENNVNSESSIKTSDKIKKITKTDQSIAATDFQLYEAINLLKGISIVKNQNQH